MPHAPAEKDTFTLNAVVTPRVAVARLAVGMLQGALLYLLYLAKSDKLWPATAPYLFAPLVLLGVLLPVLLISSLGHLAPRPAAAWMLAAALVVVGLALYDVWRLEGAPASWDHSVGALADPMPSTLLFVFCGVGLYIAHALVLAGALERRRVARYPSYFDAAWKLAIQLLFSAFFVGALWLVLWLGATLFMLIKLDFLKQLLEHSWFVIPVVCFAFSCAMHLTDVRPAIVRGIRTLLLVLLSWILPITALIAAGFMLSLPFTGLTALWATGHATGVLLGTAAVLVVLINAAYQNGEVGADVARTVAVSARVAAMLLLPIWAIGVYALGLRVNDYGWTSQRVIGAACLLVVGCYAIGYGWAARERSRWLHAVAEVNVATAFVVLAVLLALFSQLADPARLSVNNQLARFAAGKTSAAKFDYRYLRFDGARYGQQALERLKTTAQGADAALVRKKAAHAQTLDGRPGGYDEDGGPAAPKLTPHEVAANLDVFPAASRLPDSFLRQDWTAFGAAPAGPSCLNTKGKRCDAYLIDFNLDNKPEVLVFGVAESGVSVLFSEVEEGKWQALGRLPSGAATCKSLRALLANGAYRVVAPPVQDLMVGGQRLGLLLSGTPEAWSCKDAR